MAQEMAPPAQGGQEAAAQGGEDQLGSLISNLGTGMQMLVEVIQGAGAPPQVLQKAAALMEGFKSLTDDLAGGGAAPQGSQPQSPEAGGAAASPANPAMRG